jgi:iron complex outermembrane receptor protein
MNGARGITRTSLAVAIGIACTFFLCGGTRSTAAPPVYTVHISSQPLDAALQELARQTGLQILFFSRLTDGHRSPALDGMYTLDAAMVVLLSESRLTYRLINAKTIQIVPVRAAPADGKTGHRIRGIDSINCH